MGGVGNLEGGIGGIAQRELHVRLARAEPDVADHDILELLLLAAAADLHGIGATGFAAGQGHLPSALAVGFGGVRFAVENDADHASRFRSAADRDFPAALQDGRSEEHTSELQSLMRISYAVFCLKKKNNKKIQQFMTVIT